MNEWENIEGRLVVTKGFTLIDHFRAMEVNQSCYVFLRDYNRAVIRTTACKLKKEGYGFSTKGIKRGKQAPDRIKVTRIK